MGKKLKNIAVLMTAIDSDSQAKMLEGMQNYCLSHDCNLSVFVWFTGAFEKDKHNLGELNIANLPDLNLFDGVIVVSNALHMDVNRRMILDIIKDLTCPIVSIGAKLDGCHYIGTDNYHSMRKMVEHFVIDHGLKKIHFVKGIKDNPDAETRYKAYIDVLTENNIPIENERITQGDFYITGGELAVKEILSSPLEFPEAIICSNDVMAISVCDSFTDMGYNVPDDVMISGYDMTDEALNHTPSITSIQSDFTGLGEGACKILLELTDTDTEPREVLLEDIIVYNESCNKNCVRSEGTTKTEKQKHVNESFTRKLTHHMIQIEKNLMEGENYNDWISALKTFISSMNPTEFYCCINEDFEEKVFRTGPILQEAMTLEERLSYSKNSLVAVAYKDGAFYDKPSFESKYAFDELFEPADKPSLYIFSPIHYLDRNFGYFVFVNSRFPIHNLLYVSWLINMGDAIENLRKQALLKMAIDELNEMYIKDSLTGIYNRFGMNKYYAEMKDSCLKTRRNLMISFIDLDYLKQINDKFGHAEGDKIIKAVAHLLDTVSDQYKVFRYGGDEFLVMGIVDSEDEAQNYWNSVSMMRNSYNKSHFSKAEMSFSIGYQVFQITPRTQLEDCIKITDKMMYENKQRKKAARQ